MATEQTNIEDDLSNTPDYIFSVNWLDGMIGGTFLNLDTMELSIVPETIDTRPDFTYLNNLFRLLCPTYLLLNGPVTFTSEILKKLEIPDEMNHNICRKKKNCAPGRSNVVISNHDFSYMALAKTRIVKMHLPGLSTESASENERSCFAASVFPMEQNLVIISLSNLLEYIEVNFTHLLYQGSLVVSNVLTYKLESQMLIDLNTILGLQIFTSGFSITNRKRFNMYNLLNQCSSHSGMNELKEIMLQPTRDIVELHKRHETVNWCCRPSNFQIITQLRQNLRKIRNLSLLFTKLVLHVGKPLDIKSFKRSVYNAYLICELCAKLPANDIEMTFLKELADSMTESQTIKNMLCLIEYVVDLEAGEKEGRFVAHFGVDSILDGKRILMDSIKGEVHNATKDVVQLQLPGFVNDYYIAFMPGMGFMVAAELYNPNINVSLNMSNGEPIEILYRNDGLIYFVTPYCVELNNVHGDLHGKIGMLETSILHRLIQYLLESLPELTAINKLCGKLDCMIAFASVAMQRNYVQPQMTAEKCIIIEAGRHPLIELKSPFVASDTEMSEEHGSLVTILTAPNAYGKSVYIKKIALICYMAHIGCFVPAASAKIGLLDSIYSRIYCPESVEHCESSYMADVRQMSKIIMNSSVRSLVLIDEFGKGTNVREGQALLVSCLDDLISRNSQAPLTIVTTHYSEILNVLEASELVAFKTISEVQRDTGKFSSYEIVDGVFSGGQLTDYEQVSRFIGEVLESNPHSKLIDFKMAHTLATKTNIGMALYVLKTFTEAGELNIDEIFNVWTQINLDFSHE